MAHHKNVHLVVLLPVLKQLPVDSPEKVASFETFSKRKYSKMK